MVTGLRRMGRIRRRRWKRLGWVILGGLLAGAALPPRGWPWLLWPALVSLWAVSSAHRSDAERPAGCEGGGPEPHSGEGSEVMVGGLLWGMAAVLISHRWLLWLHPLDWIGVPGPLSLPLCLLLLVGCALMGGLLVMGWVTLMHRLDPTLWTSALVGASLWGLAEVALARGPLFWIGLGSSALPADRPMAGLARLGGAGLVAAAQLLIAWSLWRALGTDQQQRSRWVLLTLLLIGACHLGGALALATPTDGPGSLERVLVVQPSIPTRRKFEPDQQRHLLRQLMAAQTHAERSSTATAGGVSSVLLPEGALPLGQGLPRPAAVEVLSGGFRWEQGELRSSVLRFPPGERRAGSWVDKHRLVPLGEWVPLADWWRWSGLSAVGGIEPGAPSRLLKRPTGSIGVAICYEIADGSSLAASVRDGARWLLATANLDPYPVLLQNQFEALARLRAIETGRWVVSSANTGPSLVVDAMGRRRQRLPTARPVQAEVELEGLSFLTPYDRLGEIPLAMLLLTGAGPPLWRYLVSRGQQG